MAQTKHFGALTVAAGILAALGMLVLMLVGVNPQPAGAAFPGANGRIAYDAADGISTINPNGTGLLSPVPCSPPNHPNCNVRAYSDPSYSPDGNRIAYSAWDGQDYEIFTIPATGGTPFQVTTNTTNDREPTYSSAPAGRMIIYSGYDGQDYEIFTIPATGGTVSRVTNNTVHDGGPTYYRGRNEIAYYSRDPNGFDYEIFTISATGGTPRQLTNNGTTDQWPVYSPDGSRIAFSATGKKHGGIYTIGARGGGKTKVAEGGDDPSYSPDGTKIVYYTGNDLHGKIYTINVDGGGKSKVTEGSNPVWGSRP